MNRIMTTLAAFVCCTMTMMANPVDPAAARQAAARFLQAKGAELKNEAMQAPRRAMGQVADGQEASPYYVFNATASKGFVVVSGDDCVGNNLVLGYTDQGSFDADNVPVNMQEWLDGMASQITSLSLLGVKSRAVALHDDVAPLLTSTWGQGKPVYDPKYPYNKLCPVVGGLLSCTGCMATAMSQVLYYHRWPQEPIVGDLPGYTMYTTKTDIAPLPSVKFDWDNMLDNYNGETTEAQQMAVATLMRYCGQLLQMDYTPSISNAYAYDIDILINQFGIDQGVHLVKADEHSITEWDSLLYTELKEKRPLLHAGFSMGGGHAFVLDGYEVKDGVGFFHVNWGWDGSADGFFRIDVLNPYTSGTGGSSTSDGFAVSQQALIGFQPAKSSPEHYGRYLDTYEWNIYIEDQPYNITAYNSSHMPGKFAIATAERLADGTVDYDHILCADTLEIEGYTYTDYELGLRKAFKDIYMLDYIPDTLAPGSRHRLVFINKEADTDAPWRPIFGPNCSMEVTYGDDGKRTDFIVHPNPDLSANARSVKVVGLGGLDEMKMCFIQQTVEASITNKSDDAFNGTVYCSLYYVYNDELIANVANYWTSLFVEANDKANVNFEIYPPQVGSYVAVISSHSVDLYGCKVSALKNTPGYIGHKSVTAKELTFYVQNFSYSKANATENIKPHFDITIGNNTVMDYNSAILTKIFKLDSEGIYQPIIFSTGKDYMVNSLDVKSYGRADLRIFLEQDLEPGEYGVNFMMANDYIGSKYSDYFAFSGFDFEIEDVTGIKAVDSDRLTNAAPWFSLDGRQLDARPTAKGVYIHEGRKFVVR